MFEFTDKIFHLTFYIWITKHVSTFFMYSYLNNIPYLWISTSHMEVGIFLPGFNFGGVFFKVKCMEKQTYKTFGL